MKPACPYSLAFSNQIPHGNTMCRMFLGASHAPIPKGGAPESPKIIGP